MACTQVIENDLVDSTAFDRWKTSQRDALNRITSNTTVSDADKIVVNQISEDVNAHYDCLNTKYNTANIVSNDVNTLQTKLDVLKDAIKERKGDIAVAKDRAILTRSPELSRSYYDGWFPISRPFQHYTIPVLIAFSLFLGTMSFFYFMSIMGLSANFMYYRRDTYRKTTVINRPFLIMSFIALILLVLTIYGFTK